MSNSYLVTGATGLLGNNVVRQLLEHGHRVAVLVRPNSSRQAIKGLNVRFEVGDVTDADSIMRASSNVDCVIHSAGDLHIGKRHWERCRRVNVLGTVNVASAAQAAGIRMVHVSTVDALPASPDGSPVNEETTDACKAHCTYVVTKREADEEVRKRLQDGLDAVIVHPGFMLGPYDWKPSSGRMLLAIANHWTPAAPTGGMSGCDVRDVAAEVVIAAQQGQRGRNYILAGENMTYLSAWRLFAKVCGAKPPLFRTGPLVRIALGRGGDLVGLMTQREPDVNSAMIRMSKLLNYYSSDRATRELGYQSRPFEETARDAWQWLQMRFASKSQ